jgi:hypothetical protein
VTRLERLALAFDVALFMAGLTAVAVWGWPETLWDWSWLAAAFLPLLSRPVIRAWHNWRGRRIAAQIKAHRREKFGGFVVVPGVGPDGKRKMIRLDVPPPRD